MPDDGRPVPGGEEDTRRETFSGGLEELSDASLGSVGVRCCCEEEGGGGRGLYGAGELTNHRTKHTHLPTAFLSLTSISNFNFGKENVA
jgi:hypothetical protein